MTWGPRASRSISFTHATMRSPGRYVSRGVCSRKGRIDDDVVALLEPTHDPLDELPFPVLEFVVDEVALLVSDPLDEDLFGGLRGDATERGARLLHAQEVAVLAILLGRLLRIGRVPEDLETELLAQLGVEAAVLGIFEADLAVLVGRIVHDRHVLEQVDLARVFVEARLELPHRAEHALGRFEDRLLHRLDEPRLVDAFVFRDHLDGLHEAYI
jgi:hypothetical protein